jgi:hypothetical protein
MAENNANGKKNESCCAGMQAMIQSGMCEKMKACCPQAEKMMEMMAKCCMPAGKMESQEKSE